MNDLPPVWGEGFFLWHRCPAGATRKTGLGDQAEGRGKNLRWSTFEEILYPGGWELLQTSAPAPTFEDIPNSIEYGVLQTSRTEPLAVTVRPTPTIAFLLSPQQPASAFNTLRNRTSFFRSPSGRPSHSSFLVHGWPSTSITRTASRHFLVSVANDDRSPPRRPASIKSGNRFGVHPKHGMPSPDSFLANPSS